MVATAAYPQLTIVLLLNWDKYNPSSADTKSWDHALVNHTRSAGIPPKDETRLNLATLVIHGDEAHLEEEWKWKILHNKGTGISHDNNSICQILSLQATPGEEIKTGC